MDGRQIRAAASSRRLHGGVEAGRNVLFRGGADAGVMVVAVEEEVLPLPNIDAKTSSNTDWSARKEPIRVVLIAATASVSSCVETGLEARRTSTGSTTIGPRCTRPIPSAAHPTSTTNGMSDPKKMAIRIRAKLYLSNAHTLGSISPYTSSWSIVGMAAGATAQFVDSANLAFKKKKSRQN